VFEVHYGIGDLRTPGGFAIRVYCNMNGPSDRQVTPLEIGGVSVDGGDVASEGLERG
jgi:hypothetical protein